MRMVRHGGASEGVGNVALRACSECKKEISTDVSSCPNCGKKRPHGMSAIVKYGGGFLAVMFGLPLMVGICAGAGNRSSGSAPALGVATAAAEAPALSVSARDLWAAYDANEVAADNSYKGRRLAVTGMVASIDKDVFGDIVVKLSTGKMFNDVHATMQKSEAGAAAGLSKSARVTVVCEGNGMIIGSPILADCVFER